MQFGRAPLKCIDIRTGEIEWAQPGFGHGSVIMAGEHLIAMSDDGRMTINNPTPVGYRPLAAADVIEGKLWSSPALSDGQLLLRSTTQGVCLEL